jgi:hypothetical protein
LVVGTCRDTALVGTALSGGSAIVVWFVTNVVLGPWVERRRRLAADKLKHDMEHFKCGGDECRYDLTVPRWFINRTLDPPKMGCPTTFAGSATRDAEVDDEVLVEQGVDR